VPAWIVGVDTGGTLTDLIAFEQTAGGLRFAKVPSVPDDPSLAVSNALGKLFESGVKPSEITCLVHGTIVATNAILESKGVRTGLLITHVFFARSMNRGAGRNRAAAT
jgi:N-methylhydantoinase A